MPEIDRAETMREIIARRVGEMWKQHVPTAGSFGRHAFGNIIGSMRTRVADGKMTPAELAEAVDEFNKIVPGGRIKWIRKGENIVPSWVEGES